MRTAFLMLLLVVAAAGHSSARFKPQSPPAMQSNHAEDRRLNAMLQQLNRIELRLAIVEAGVLERDDFWIDKAGVMRVRSGRPIGHWGIDGPPLHISQPLAR